MSVDWHRLVIAIVAGDRRSLAGMRKPAHIVLRQADEKTHCRALGITLHEYESDTTLMFMRGPGIVEGLLRVMIDNTDITIHKSKVCRCRSGNDRCGS
jgi:dipicolinate synthase subunit A